MKNDKDGKFFFRKKDSNKIYIFFSEEEYVDFLSSFTIKYNKKKHIFEVKQKIDNDKKRIP